MNIINENENNINNVKKVKKNKSLLVKKNVKVIDFDDELELEFIKIQNNEEKKESNDNFDYMNDLEYIKKFISNNEISKNEKKKQNGEVFTPYEIIIKMLNELEKTYFLKYNKNIYSNKDLKWFDNSSGIGNFMIVIYYKLNIGLKVIIPDNKMREKHILENMLYMSELDKNNVDNCIKYFNPNCKYKLNINCGDSLIFDIKKIFKIDNVDIIIGNPPYQKPNNKNNSARGGTNNNLYIDFIKKSIEQLNNDGYLVYIHPQNWRKIGVNILNDILAYKIDFLGLNYGGKLFKNVSVNTDLYVICKTKNNNFDSVVECYDKKNKLIMEDKFKINDVDFIPKYYSKDIQSILTKILKYGENRNCIINSFCHKIREHVSHIDDKTDKHIYPLYNTSGNPYCYFSLKKHFDQDKKKVIMSCSGKLSPVYDNGKYGTTQDSMYIIVNNDIEGNGLVKILNSDLYVFLNKICQWGNFRNEQKIYEYIKFPPITNEKIDNDYINQFFKLSKNEIKCIDKIIELIK